MERVASGLAAIAVAFASGPAFAGPFEADLWIGVEGGNDGFLIETETGGLWMTGVCLKPLEKAEKTGTVWESRTAEIVSVGRAMAMLDQTFSLDVNPAQPTISVFNPNRGGPQSFPAVLRTDCVAGGCADLARQPVCED